MQSEHIDPKEIKEIKDSLNRIEEALLGSIHDGQPVKGLFEQVRLHGQDIDALKVESKQIKELNKSIESLYRLKYYFIGGGFIVLFLINRIIEFIISFFSGLWVNHK